MRNVRSLEARNARCPKGENHIKIGRGKKVPAPISTRSSIHAQISERSASPVGCAPWIAAFLVVRRPTVELPTSPLRSREVFAVDHLRFCIRPPVRRRELAVTQALVARVRCAQCRCSDTRYTSLDRVPAGFPCTPNQPCLSICP